MKRSARYHLAWAIVVFIVSMTVMGYAGRLWWVQGRPPVYRFWAAQMLVVSGAYFLWGRIKAFNNARK